MGTSDKVKDDKIFSGSIPIKFLGIASYTVLMGVGELINYIYAVPRLGGEAKILGTEKGSLIN